MTSDLPYKLLYHGTEITKMPVDISDHVVSIDKFTDVGTGEIVSAKIMLDARLGNFITEANRIGSPSPDRIEFETPILKQYDVMYLEITMLSETTDTPANTYSRYLIVDDLIPLVNSDGQFLSVELFGRERYLQKMLFPGHFYFISYKNMIQTIVDFYNRNKGKKQPPILNNSVELSDHTYGIFDFAKETSCYDALMEVVKRCTVPTAAGGEGEYYGLTFAEGTTNTGEQVPSTIELRIAPQGHYPTDEANRITLDKPMQLSEVKEPSKASILIVEGKPGTGTMPPEPALYKAYIEYFANLPLFKRGIKYKAGAYVQWNGDRWKARIDNTNVNPSSAATQWQKRTLADYIGEFYSGGISDFQYSPWTKDKAVVWRNWCGNPDGNLFDPSTATTTAAPNQFATAYAVPDSNFVIREEASNIWRDSVDLRLSQITKDILDKYLYPTASGVNPQSGLQNSDYRSRQYEGFRVLCDAAPSATPTDTNTRNFVNQFNNNGTWQKDALGKSFKNNAAVFTEAGDWIVFRETKRFDEYAVWHEGKVWKWTTARQHKTIFNARDVFYWNTDNLLTPLSNFAWRDASDVHLGNDCFHYPNEFQQAEGLHKLDAEGIQVPPELTKNSAIQIGYQYNPNPTDVPSNELPQRLKEIDQFVEAVSAKGNTDNGEGFWGDFVWNGLYRTSEYFNAAFNEAISNEVYEFFRGPMINNLGWWATLFSTPFPRTKYGSIGENVGQIFGGNTNLKVPVLDLRNLNYTPTGKTGYKAADAMNLGEISGFRFLFKFEIDGVSIDTWRGSIPFRAFIETTRGEILISDKTYRFQNVTQLVEFRISDFKLYRARVPISMTAKGFVDKVLSPELSITEIFERRKVKRIGIQLMFDYDDQGRFDPMTLWGMAKTAIGLFADTSGVVPLKEWGGQATFRGTIDWFHFIKDNIVISQNNTDSKFTPEAQLTDIDNYHLTDAYKRYPNIDNVLQLQLIANSDLDIENFQQERWTATYMDEVRVKAENTVYVKDSELIPATEGGGNTRKLIAKKITYSVGDRAVNSGMKTTIDLYKKIIPRRTT